MNGQSWLSDVREAEHLNTMIPDRNPAANSHVTAEKTKPCKGPHPFHSVSLPLLQATGPSRERIKEHTGCDVSLAGTQAGGGASKVVVHLYYQIHLLNKHSASTYYVPSTLLRAGWWRGLDLVHTFKAVRILAGEGNVSKRLQGNGISARVFSTGSQAPGSRGGVLLITVTPLPRQCLQQMISRVKVCGMNWTRARMSGTEPRGRSSPLYLEAWRRLHHGRCNEWAGIQTREEDKHPPRDQHASQQRHMNDHVIPGTQRTARLEARVHIREQQDWGARDQSQKGV